MIVPGDLPTTGTPHGSEASLADWVEELADRIQAGEAVDFEAYAREHPERAEELRRLLPTIEMMAAFGRSSAACATSSRRGGTSNLEGALGDFRILREVGRGGMGIVYEAEQESLGRRVALKVMADSRLRDPKLVARFRREAKAAARLHHTNIVPVFGVGEAEGVHYYVMQLIRGLGLDRVLDEVRRLRGRSAACEALPSPSPSPLPEPPPRPARPSGAPDVFVSEMARSLVSGGLAATVDHEGPAPSDPERRAVVVDRPPLDSTSISTSGSITLPGQTDVDLSSATSPGNRYARSVARIGLQVAEALAYAHEQGTLHRDIKPSNLLLDGRGNVWVADFGLAKHADSDLTHTGDVVGTLRYMAPERFEGRCDARSDVCALGLTLYELLAMRPAFAADDRNALIREVTQAEPKRLRALDRSIPRDLETIVHKAIEKAPAHRYESAQALADDLRRFLEDGPIAARRIGLAERLLRWGRRNPIVAGLTATVFLLLAGVALLSSAAALRIEQSAEEARAEDRRASQALDAEARARKEVEQANAQLRAAREAQRRTLYAARMNLARAAWDANNVARLLRLLELERPGPGQADLRGWEWYYWWRLARPEHRSIPMHIQSVRSVAFSPDGTRLLAAGGEWPSRGEIAILDVASGDPILSLGFEGGPALDAAYSPDGTRIAAACWGKDGARSDTVAGRIEIRDAATGRELLTIREGIGLIVGLAFSPDGMRIAAVETRQAHADARVKVWDTSTGREQLSIDVPTSVGYDHDIAFTPDGKRIASGGYGTQAEVKVWDAADGRELLTLKGHTGPVSSLAFSPDGRRIATAGSDTTIRLWDASSGRELLALKGRVPQFLAVAFSPDGTRIAGAGWDRTVTIWDAGDGRELTSLKAHLASISCLAFSADGRRLASGARDGMVKVWEGPTDRKPLVAGERGETASMLAYHPDGSRIITVERPQFGARQLVKVRDAADGRVVMTLAAHTGNIHAAAYSPDGTRIVTAGGSNRRQGEAKVWDAADGRELLTLGPHPGPVLALALSPDGTRIVTAAAASPGEPGAVTVWDAATGRELRTLNGIASWVRKVVYSADGRRLVTVEDSASPATSPGSIRIWDAETGRQLLIIRAPALLWIRALVLSPDGTRLAAEASGPYGESGAVKVWDAANGRELFVLEGHSYTVNGLAFSPDGTRLVTSSLDRTVKLWDAAEGEELLTLGGDTGAGPFLGVAFSPDGRRIAAAGQERPLTIWHAPLCEGGERRE